MDFIKISAVQESDEFDYEGAELIRIVDIKKIYADISGIYFDKSECDEPIYRIFIEYYNHKTDEIRKLTEKFNSRYLYLNRIEELLELINS